jgi:predicted nucleic acid-binding protein
VRLLTLDLVDIPRIRELMIKYADRPIDLADAALVRVAEREGIRKIFTVDRNDFTVYRIHGRIGFAIVP